MERRGSIGHRNGVARVDISGEGLLKGRDLRPLRQPSAPQHFDYRGDVTIQRKDGSKVEGYIFDRRTGRTLADSVVRLFLKDRPQKIAIPYSDVAGLEFTGRDTAAGKSWAAWVKKYWEKKAAGEAQIELTPEKLD